MKSKEQKDASTLLPQSFISFILKHIDEFDAHVNGESIVIAPKSEHGVVRQQVRPAASPTRATSPVLQLSSVRPKFLYTVADRKLTSDKLLKYGLSEQRTKVYSAIYDSVKGLQSKDILTKTGLPHGTVQQILHWLRDRKLINGEPVV